MRITIVNSLGRAEEPLTGLLKTTEEALTQKAHFVRQIVLNALDIKYCIGCWGGWVKTPGECNIRDDSAIVASAIVNSDFVLFASPLIMGFVNARMKTVLDKLIPILHPYIQLVDNEMHHQPRYTFYPGFGVLVHPEPDTDEEDQKIIRRIFDRLALNMHSRCHFVFTTETSAKSLCHEIDHFSRLAKGA